MLNTISNEDLVTATGGGLTNLPNDPRGHIGGPVSRPPLSVPGWNPQTQDPFHYQPSPTYDPPVRGNPR